MGVMFRVGGLRGAGDREEQDGHQVLLHAMCSRNSSAHVTAVCGNIHLTPARQEIRR
jgi:hypothetical protein